MLDFGLRREGHYVGFVRSIRTSDQLECARHLQLLSVSWRQTGPSSHSLSSRQRRQASMKISMRKTCCVSERAKERGRLIQNPQIENSPKEQKTMEPTLAVSSSIDIDINLPKVNPLPTIAANRWSVSSSHLRGNPRLHCVGQQFRYFPLQMLRARQSSGSG
ncbi:hypothetical protein BJX64DRAFT_263320 [Aspergillus heterothallicus]